MAISERTRRAFLTAAGVAVLGGTASARASGLSDLRIRAVSLPDLITEDESFEVSIIVENTGDEPVDVPPYYWFDGEKVAEGGGDDLPIGAGDTKGFNYPGFTLSVIEESLGGPVSAGEHQHTIGFPGGPQETRSVVVQRGNGGNGTAAPSSDGGSDNRRGFFTNGGDSPEFVDEVNLTIAGFVLSIAGILHQLTSGR